MSKFTGQVDDALIPSYRIKTEKYETRGIVVITVAIHDYLSFDKTIASCPEETNWTTFFINQDEQFSLSGPQQSKT